MIPARIVTLPQITIHNLSSQAARIALSPR